MTTNYQLELQKRSSAAYIASSVKSAKALLEKFRPWLEKYRGGVPIGWAAAIMLWESNGNWNAPGDPTLGEIGYYQVARYVPGTMGMPEAARTDPETNVFIGLMEYQLDTVKWHAKFPQYVRLPSDDAYKLARLSFAIGWGGSTGLAAKAIAAGGVAPGNLYGGIRDYVARTGGVPLGSQSAAQVWFRVLSIEGQWEIGKQVAWSPSGPPTLVPHPPKYTYTIPMPYRVSFSEPVPMVFIGAMAVGAYILWRLAS